MRKKYEPVIHGKNQSAANAELARSCSPSVHCLRSAARCRYFFAILVLPMAA